MSDELPVLEYGRYKLRKLADGGILISRATGTCDRCEKCGCGEQAEPVPIPGVITKVMSGQHVDMGEIMGLMAQFPAGAFSPAGLMRRLIGRGRSNGHGGGDADETAESSGAAGGDLAGVSAAGLSDQESRELAGDGSAPDSGEV